MKTKTCGECRHYNEENSFCVKWRFEDITAEAEVCKGFAPPTNGDRIRQMSNEELVDRIHCPYENCINEFVEDVDCGACKIHWLNAPAESCVKQNGNHDTQTDLSKADHTENEGKDE